jgi:hypothetical protein
VARGSLMSSPKRKGKSYVAHFVATDDGLINLDYVAKVVHITVASKNGTKTRKLRYLDRDGDHLATSGDHLDPEAICAPLIPAAPGSFAIMLYADPGDDTRPSIDNVLESRVAIIAWRILRHTSEAVFLEEEGDTFTVIPEPDGSYRRQYVQIYQDLDAAKRAAVDEACENWERRQAAKAEADTNRSE